MGDKKIKDIEIREPTAGELRGVKLLDIFQMEVAAYQTLLPRITTPALTQEHVSALPMSDISKMMVGVIRFFDSATDFPNA